MDIQIYDSFQQIVGTLAKFGYMMPMVKMSPLKVQAHRFARIMIPIVFNFYNFQQLVNIYRVRDDLNLIIDNAFSLVSAAHATQRMITFQIRWRVFDAIRDVINDPVLAPRNEVHVKLIADNTRKMNRIATIILYAVSSCSAFWISVPLSQRIQHGYAAAYFPFDTTTFFGFLLARGWDATVMWFVGIGGMTCDTYIAALYSQATVQVSIIRYELEHIADSDGDNNEYYRDIHNKEIRARFIHCVQRYKKITELNALLEDIFSRLLLMQIIASALAICFVTYKISMVTAVNSIFMWMVVYLGCVLTELFLFCRFGTDLYEESQRICESLYVSDWVHLSPAFRRLMLIAMARWLRPMEPLAARLIPMSLNTFLRVIKGAYSMFTVLKNSARD